MMTMPTATTMSDGWGLLRAIENPGALRAILEQVDAAKAKLETREKAVQERERVASTRGADYAAAVAEFEQNRQAHAKDTAAHAKAVAKFNADKEATEAAHAAKSAALAADAEALSQLRDEVARDKSACETRLADAVGRELAVKAREEAVKAAEDRVAAMKTEYEKKLAIVRSVGATVAA